MGRHKEKDSVKVCFNIDREINEGFCELVKLEKMSKSAFIEMLILRWDEGINPESKLNSLINERERVDLKLKYIDNKLKETGEHITFLNKIKRNKNRKRPEAISIIEKLMMENKLEEAERVSKVWQRQTGISSFELLLEAKNNTEKKGT